MTNSISGTKPTITLFTSAVLHYDSEGNYRTIEPLVSEEKWAVYLPIFSRILLVARVSDIVSDQGFLVLRPGVEVIHFPFYRGTKQFFTRYKTIKNEISRIVSDSGGKYGIWGTGPLTELVLSRVNKINADLLLFIIGDAEVVARAIFPWPFNIPIATMALRQARRQAKAASAVVYVTLKALQSKYPSSSGAMTLARTHLSVPSAALSLKRKTYRESARKNEIRLISIGSQQQNYKGHDLLIKALSLLNTKGRKVHLTLVGDGKLHDDLIKQANDLNLGNIEFIKNVGETFNVIQLIGEQDIFILPSRTEGMPKVLLEAMSIGVFCLGSNVGGIPEILDKDCLFEPNSVTEIVNKLEFFIDNPDQVVHQVAVQKKMFEYIQNDFSGNAKLIDFLTRWASK